jgi:hypothetical protein
MRQRAVKPAIYSAGQFPNCNDFSASTMSAFTVAVRRWGRAQVVAPRGGSEMRKIIIGAMTSLDGVMQGPGGPHEDPIGGFRYGGWVAPFDAVAGEAVGEMFAQPRRLEGVRLRCDGEQVLP